MKLTAHNEQNGVITLKCKRGSVCEMIAGYQQTREQDAAHIIKCVNAHDELVAALDKILRSSRSKGNGAVMGEAVLCPYFESMIDDILRRVAP